MHNNDTFINPWSVRKTYSIYEANFLFNCFIKSYGAIKPLDFCNIFPILYAYGNLEPSGCTLDFFGTKDIST